MVWAPKVCNCFYNLKNKTNMKIYALALLLALGLQACNDGNNNNGANLKDPSVMQPPSDAIPDSTKLVNDSVIMPDTTPGNRSQVGQSDSIQRAKE
jgi:hypothetical protein